MRKKQSKKRPLLPDPKYKDQLVTRFVNNLMKHGKKSVSYKIFYDSISIVEDKNNEDENNNGDVIESFLLLSTKPTELLRD